MQHCKERGAGTIRNNLRWVPTCDTPCLLQLMGGEQELAEAVRWLEGNLKLDVDARIHVFELTIRALGAPPASCRGALSHDPGLCAWPHEPDSLPSPLHVLGPKTRTGMKPWKPVAAAGRSLRATSCTR